MKGPEKTVNITKIYFLQNKGDKLFKVVLM